MYQPFADKKHKEDIMQEPCFIIFASGANRSVRKSPHIRTFGEGSQTVDTTSASHQYGFDSWDQHVD